MLWITSDLTNMRVTWTISKEFQDVREAVYGPTFVHSGPRPASRYSPSISCGLGFSVSKSQTKSQIVANPCPIQARQIDPMMCPMLCGMNSLVHWPDKRYVVLQ